MPKNFNTAIFNGILSFYYIFYILIVDIIKNSDWQNMHLSENVK